MSFFPTCRLDAGAQVKDIDLCGVCVCVQSRLMQLCINQDHPSPHTLLSEGDEAFAPRFHAHEPETNSR